MDFYDNRRALTSGVAYRGEPASMTELFDAVVEGQRRIDNDTAMRRYLEEAYDKRNKEIEGLGLKPPAHPFWHTPSAEEADRIFKFGQREGDVRGQIGGSPFTFPPQAPGSILKEISEAQKAVYLMRQYEADLEALERDNPELATRINAKRTPFHEVVERMQQAERRRNEAWAGRSEAYSWFNLPQVAIGLGAGFGGGLFGQLESPKDIAANLLGGVAGSRAQSLLRNALKNAAANAGVQGVLEPGIQAQREAAGLDFGWMNAIESVAAAGALGAGLDVAFRAPVRAFNRSIGQPGPYGGIFRDAPVEARSPRPESPETPEPSATPAQPIDLAIDPELRARAEAGDLAAMREIVDKVDALKEDPLVRGALAKAEAEEIAPVKIDGTPEPDADRVMLQVIRASQDPDEPAPRVPDVVPEAANPLDAERGARLYDDYAGPLDRLMRAAEDRLNQVDPRLVQRIDRAIEAGIGEVLEFVEAAVKKIDAGAKEEAVAQAFVRDVLSLANTGGLDRLNAIADMHSGLADPMELARAMRAYPDIIDSNIPDIESVTLARSLAALSEDAFAKVERGEASALAGQVVSDHVADPSLHASILDTVTRAGLTDPELIRRAIPDLLPVDKDPSLGPLDAGSTMDDPMGPEAKAQTERLKASLAEEVAQAQQTLAARQAQEQAAAQAEAERVAMVQRAEEVRAAIAGTMGIVPSDYQVKVFSSFGDLPEGAAAEVMRANAKAFADALQAFQSAPTEEARLAARMALDTASAGRFVDAFTAEDTIWIGAHAMNPQGRMAHEVVHALVASGRLTRDELALLADAGRRSNALTPDREATYRAAYGERNVSPERLAEMLDEEAAAHLVEAWNRVKPMLERAAESTPIPVESTRIDGVVARLQAFFGSVREAIQRVIGREAKPNSVTEQPNSGTAKPNSDSANPVTTLLDAILSGEIAKRQGIARVMRQEDVSAVAVRGGEGMQQPLPVRLGSEITTAIDLIGLPAGSKGRVIEIDDGRYRAGLTGERLYTVEFGEGKARLTRIINDQHIASEFPVSMFAIRSDLDMSPAGIAGLRRRGIIADADKLPWGGRRYMIDGNVYTSADAVQRIARDEISLPSAAELRDAARLLDDGEMRILTEEFGGDTSKAKRWKELWNISEREGNGPRAEKADAEREQLSKEATGNLDSIEIGDAPTMRVLQGVFEDMERNPTEIPDILVPHLAQLPLSEKSPAGWTLPEAKAVAIMRKAGFELQANNLDVSAIARDLQKKYTSYFSDPNDAIFMVEALMASITSRAEAGAVRPDAMLSQSASPNLMFAIRDAETGRDMRRAVDALGYYSKLDEVLGSLNPKDKVTLDTLLQKGVKKAEIEARGLMELFGSRERRDNGAVNEASAPVAFDKLPSEVQDDIAGWLMENVPAVGEWAKGSPEYARQLLHVEPAIGLRVGEVNLADLTGYARNPSQAAVNKYQGMLASSEAPPILVDGTKFIDGGHRVAAYRNAGRKTIPAVDIGPLIRMDWKTWIDGGETPSAPMLSQMLQRQGDRTDSASARDTQLNQSVPVSSLIETAGRNRVEVREVEYGPLREKIDKSSKYALPEVLRAVEQSGDTPGDLALTLANDGDAYRALTRRFPELRQDEDWADTVAQSVFGGDSRPTGTAKWQNYSLDPSNPSYRETVLHLPERPIRPSGMAGQSWGDDVTFTDVGSAGDPNFRQHHFSDVPNIIGHMMTSMVKHEGRPVYLIDQIQSDWGQKLRDGGVRDEAKIAELKARLAESPEFDPSKVSDLKTFSTARGLNIAFRYDGKYLTDTLATMARQSDIDAAIRSLATPNERKLLEAELRTAEAATPGNPLVNTTDQWVNTTLRRAIRQAAEADAEYIAIPTGETVLSYNPGDENGMGQFYGRNRPHQVERFDASTRSVVKAEVRGPVEGIVPKNLRNILTKLDKASPAPIKVDQVETPSKGMAGSGFTLFPLTDKVKADVVQRGQVMFAFAGERARTADLEALARAKLMEMEGTDRTKIWTSTGWFRGVDGKWKWEIDDRGAAVFPGYLEMTGKSENSAPFRDRMMHTNYLNAYPDAENLNIQRMSGRQYPEFANKGGYFDRQGLWIDGAQPDGGRSIALHEIQHDAQMREGFARGGNMRQFTQDEIAAERARILQLDDGNSWTRVGNSAGDMADSEVARRLYNRLAGEVEARAVQKRMDLTPEERRARPPWLDYDVPEDQQIVRFADGSSGTMFAIRDDQPVTPGLDMSPEARKQRAEAMGFDTSRVAYRGLSKPYDADATGFYQMFTSNPYEAGEYAMGNPMARPNVVPAWLRKGKNLLIDAREANFNNIWAGSIPDESVRRRLRGESVRTDEIAHAAREAGYDSVTITNVYDNATNERTPKPKAVSAEIDAQRKKKLANELDALLAELGDVDPGPPTQSIPEGYTGVPADKRGPVTIDAIFNKNQARSINAAFDPANSSSPNLMYAIRDDATPDRADMVARLTEALVPLAETARQAGVAIERDADGTITAVTRDGTRYTVERDQVGAIARLIPALDLAPQLVPLRDAAIRSAAEAAQSYGITLDEARIKAITDEVTAIMIEAPRDPEAAAAKLGDLVQRTMDDYLPQREAAPANDNMAPLGPETPLERDLAEIQKMTEMMDIVVACRVA